MRLPGGSREEGRSAPVRRPFAPTVPFCTAPAHAGLCLGAGGRVEGPGLQVQPVHCEGTTLRQAGRALPSRPVRFLAAPRHPARPPLWWEVAFAARPSCLRAHAPSSCWPPPWPGRRAASEFGRLAQDGRPSGPLGPGPSSSVAVALADGAGCRAAAWSSLPRLGLGLCTWVDWAEPVAVWTCVRPPQGDQPQVDQSPRPEPPLRARPCRGPPSASEMSLAVQPEACTAAFSATSEMAGCCSLAFTPWRNRAQSGPAGRCRARACSPRWPPPGPAPLLCAGPSVPIKQAQQSWGALTGGDFIS